MYEVTGKSATFQKQSVCASTADGWEAQGRETCITTVHHAGYKAGLEVEEGQRDTCFHVLS